jgi:hypothetical protein
MRTDGGGMARLYGREMEVESVLLQNMCGTLLVFFGDRS